jgi:hypothetical protein
MEVTAVGLKFMRRIQISQYEPAEVEFTLHAALEDGESHVDAGIQLAADARAMIKEAFAGLVKGTEPTKAKRGRPSEKDKEAARAKAEADATASGVPGDDKTGPPTGPPVSEIPDTSPPKNEIPSEDGPPVDGPPTEEQGVDPVTLPKLQAFINEVVTKKKLLNTNQIKDVLKTFGVARTVELKKEDVPRMKDALDTLLGAAA